MTASEQALTLTRAAVQAAIDRKAEEVLALDVSGQLALTDVFVIASASNERQVNAIVDAVEETLHKRGVSALRREGRAESRWVLVDFGDIVVHVLHAQDRVYYDLERLWKDCPVIEVPAIERDGQDAA